MEISEKKSCVATSLPLNARVNSLLFDCGFAVQNGDENLVARGRRIASYFGVQFMSVLAVVEELELLMYGSLRSGHATSIPPHGSNMLAIRTDGVVPDSGPAAQGRDENLGQYGEAKHEVTSAAGNNKLQFNTSNIALILVLPWVTEFIWGFSYSSIALYYRSQGWPIVRLSVVVMVGNFIRPFFVNGLISRFGAWVAAPLSVVALILVFPAVIWTESEIVIAIELATMFMFFLELSLQTICFSQFSHSKDLLQRASRIQTLSLTTGYALSPFVGGVGYDLAGWKGCALMHLAAQSILTIGYCTSPYVWKDFNRWKAGPSLENQDSVTQVIQPEQKRKKVTGIAAAFPIMAIPGSIRLPVFMVALAVATCAYSYKVEWATYALYFREEHNWTQATWAGVCQMSGDVVGAIMLIVSNKLKKSNSSEVHSESSASQSQSRCLIFKQPYLLAWLLGFQGVLCAGMAAHSLNIVIASQVLMGTVYVFFMQWTNELNMLYACGDGDLYAMIRTMSLVIFVVMCSAAEGALIQYEYLGSRSPFYTCAALCFFVTIIYVLSFLLRIGCVGDFERIEVAHGKQSLTEGLPAPSESEVIQVAPAGTKNSASAA